MTYPRGAVIRLRPRLALLAVVAVALAVACMPPPRRPTPPLPREAYAHYLRGRALFFEADYERALAELDAAALAAPGEAGIAVARVETLARLGRREEAVAAIGAAASRWPRAPEVWLAAGELYRATDDLRRAAVAYRRALELDRALAAAYLGLAATETRARRPEAAERVYRDLVAALPESADGHEQLARHYLARHDDAAATPHLRRVMELDGDRLDAHRALAAVHVRAGRLDEAVAVMRVAYDRSGGALALGADLVWLLLERGERAAAIELLARYDDAVPADAQADAAAMLAALGELPRALAMAEAADARGHDTTLVRARVLIALRRTAQARDALEEIDARHRTWPVARALEIEALLAAGRVPDARAVAAAALPSAPAHVALVAATAEAARRDGDAAAGRAAFRRAIATRPHDGELALAWAAFESRAGAPARALALAEQVLAATPDAAGALNQVGYTLVELGRDLPRARGLLARARGLAPGDPGVLDSWGWLLRAEGDLAGADRALARAVSIAPHEPEILLHASAVARARGGRGRAARLAALALAHPAPPEVRAAAAAALADLGSPRLPPCYARVHMKTPAPVRVLLGSLLAAAACADTPSKGQCEQLLTHLIDLEASATGVKGTKDEVEKQKQAIREYAVGQKFVETCSRETPKRVVACGLAAKNMDEIAACDAGK